jgi:UDP-GlcNAc:undecaprenyl-phosphate GlcNAc-1-phosphate transferase
MAVPMLDVLRVIIKRTMRKKSIFAGDSEHLHFRLLESGLNQRQAVFLLYSIAFVFGISTLFLQSNQKLLALAFLFLLMLLLSIWFLRKKT